MRTVAVVVVIALAAGCPAATDTCAEEPAYGGQGNDEVWLTLRDAKAEAVHDGDFATVTSPASDAVLPADAAPTLSWESPLKLALAAPPTVPVRPTHSWLDAAATAAAHALVPPAHAHLPPVSSDAYLVDIVVPGRTCPVSIVTTELAHTLDEGSWSALKEAAGQSLVLELTSAYLASGRIQEGPFAAAPVVFQVGFQVE